MENAQKLYSVSQLHNLDEAAIKQVTADWLVMARLLFEPDTMQINGKARAFDLTELQTLLASFTLEEDNWICLKNNEEESSIHLLKGTLLEKSIIKKTTYEYWQAVFLDYQMARLKRYGFFAYIRSYDEYLYHNTYQIEKRRQFESAQATEQLPKMRGLNGEESVDCNAFPGYDVFYKGFCLTSCWRIFFGKEYKKLFPKQLLLEVQQVEEVTEMGDGVIIELYKDPFQWDEAINLRFQRLFRDQLGIPQLSYTNGVGVLKEPYTEFAFEDTLIQTVQYQNDQYQPTEKSKASVFVTRTYDFLNEKYQVHRLKGSLNILAYFPWIDDEGEKMMNYHVLYPELTLDKGVSAYEYYIRDLIELKVEDDRFEEYTAILQLFIPKSAMDDFPLVELKEKLGDVTIHQISHKKHSISLSLEKAENKLVVLFIDQQQASIKEEANIAGM